MKRRKRRRTPLAGHYQPHAAPVRDRRIVPIDDAPLRKRAATEFNKAMAKLEKARAELRCFEQQDRPSFGRWMASTFGALLTELRENSRLASEQEFLIREVEMEMMISDHRNPRKAYAAVMKRRENPGKFGDFSDWDESANDPAGESDEGWDDLGDDDPAPFEDMAAEIPQKERKAIFESFVREVLGFNPRDLGSAAYADMFAEFEAEMFGKAAKARPARVDRAKDPAPDREQDRIKEIYRTLVRRLHPDLRADGNATVSAIWHDVQEAYEARNLDRLETLLALTEMENGTIGAQTTLANIHGALAELDNALRAIKRSIGHAKRDPAWGFSRNPYHGPIEKRIRREMEEDLEEQRSILADLKRILDDWTRPWIPPVGKPRKQPAQPAKSQPARTRRGSNIREPVQTEFW